MAARPGFVQPLERPKVRAQVLAWVLEDKTDSEIAKLLPESQRVTRQAITAFRQRHTAELGPATAKIERDSLDYAIASKVNRIAALDDLLQRMQAEIAEYGLAVTEVEYIEGKEDRRIETRNFRATLVREIRAVIRDASEELGQLPRAPEANVTVNVGVAVDLVWQDGTPA